MNTKLESHATQTIPESVSYLARYMESYDKQTGFEGYSSKTYINDVLYGLGMSLNPELFRWNNGFEKFKVFLQEYLEKNEGTGRE